MRYRMRVRNVRRRCSMTRIRSRSPPSFCQWNDDMFPSAMGEQRRSRSNSRLREPAGFIVLKMSIQDAYIAPRSVYLRNDPPTLVRDVKEKIYDDIERIPLKQQQLFFLDPTRIARAESGMIAIEPLDFWQPLALYGITNGAEIMCVRWCSDCCRTLCDCEEEYGCPDAWRDVLYSGSTLMLNDLDGLSEEEDMLFDWSFPE